MATIVTAQFRDKHGGVYYGPVELIDGVPPRRAKLEQHAGVFEYDHDGDQPVYREV